MLATERIIMSNILYDLLFCLVTVYILFKVIGYSIYEINEMNNKTGGFIIISFSILIVIFSNIMVIIN